MNKKTEEDKEDAEDTDVEASDTDNESKRVSDSTHNSAEMSAPQETGAFKGPEPFTVRHADALMDIAAAYLKNADHLSSGADRYLVTLHVNSDALVDVGGASDALDPYFNQEGPDSNRAGHPVGTATQTHTCLNPQAHLQTGVQGDKDRAVAIQTARRIACDAAIIAMIDGPNGEPLNIGRKTRKVPPAMYRALRRRDQGCQYPGCTHSKWVQAHHIQHWGDAGETRLDNLVLLCTKHHHAVHEGGHNVRVVDSDNDSESKRFWALEFTNEHGKVIPRTADQGRRGNVHHLRRANVKERGLKIDAATNECQWLGESIDYGSAVEALMTADNIDA